MTSRHVPPLGYTGGRLDRAGARRHDPAWLAAMRAHPEARLVPVWRDRNLVTEGGPAGPRAAWLAGERFAALAEDDGLGLHLLGVDGDVPVFTADLSALDDDRAAALAAEARGAAFVDLRRVGASLGADDAALLAYARGLTGWHRRARHCGVCGRPTRSEHAGHMRRCSDDACAVEIYPRTDPAVIMLVEHVPADGGPRRCLLARHTRLPARMYSTLAGFLEPGESLEEAVAREVMEETGVRVSRVVYQGSQPWPFPASLMVGFRATAESQAIELDRTELDEASWFTADEVAAFGEWEDEQAAYRLPRRDSIARALVEAWVADVRAG